MNLDTLGTTYNLFFSDQQAYLYTEKARLMLLTLSIQYHHSAKKILMENIQK